MKKLPHSWKILDKIILNILSSDLHIHDNSIKIVLSCNFENIVKGRCNLIINEKKKKEEEKRMTIRRRRGKTRRRRRG